MSNWSTSGTGTASRGTGNCAFGRRWTGRHVICRIIDYCSVCRNSRGTRVAALMLGHEGSRRVRRRRETVVGRAARVSAAPD